MIRPRKIHWTEEYDGTLRARTGGEPDFELYVYEDGSWEIRGFGYKFFDYIRFRRALASWRKTGQAKSIKQACLDASKAYRKICEGLEVDELDRQGKAGIRRRQRRKAAKVYEDNS